MVLWFSSSCIVPRTILKIYKNYLPIFAIGSLTVPVFFNTMRKQFTSYEWQTIKCQTTEWKQLEMFYRHWVSFKNRFKASTVIQTILIYILKQFFLDNCVQGEKVQ